MVEINKKEVGKRIYNIRVSRGETMQEFANHFKTNTSTINNWEKGRNLPSRKNLNIVSNLGKLKEEEILHGSTEEQTLIEENLKLWLTIEKNIIGELSNIKVMEGKNIKLSEQLEVLQDVSNAVTQAVALIEQQEYDEAMEELNLLSDGIDNVIMNDFESLIDIKEHTEELERQLELARDKINEYINKS